MKCPLCSLDLNDPGPPLLFDHVLCESWSRQFCVSMDAAALAIHMALGRCPQRRVMDCRCVLCGRDFEAYTQMAKHMIEYIDLPAEQHLACVLLEDLA